MLRHKGLTTAAAAAQGFTPRQLISGGYEQNVVIRTCLHLPLLRASGIMCERVGARVKGWHDCDRRTHRASLCPSLAPHPSTLTSHLSRPSPVTLTFHPHRPSQLVAAELEQRVGPLSGVEGACRLLSAGYTAREAADTCSAPDMRSAGFSLQELQDTCVDESKLRAGGSGSR